jgi:hypothetical protein
MRDTDGGVQVGHPGVVADVAVAVLHRMLARLVDGVLLRNVSRAANEREDASQRLASRSCDGADGSMPL